MTRQLVASMLLASAFLFSFAPAARADEVIVKHDDHHRVIHHHKKVVVVHHEPEHHEPEHHEEVVVHGR